jgi:flagellar hook-basal body complex protein FliE
VNVARFSTITAPDLIRQAADRPADPARAQDFKDLLREGIDRLGRLEADAASQAQALMHGEPVELHRVVLAGEEAALAFELTLSVRNKVVEAYQEVMRMQV